jgi:hypothetical protein
MFFAFLLAQLLFVSRTSTKAAVHDATAISPSSAQSSPPSGQQTVE